MEFKQSTGEMREIVETGCSFANARGGTILIGVTNNGTIRGVAIGQDTLESLSNTIQQQTDPKVFSSLITVTVDSRTVVVLRVEENPIKPVLAYGRGFKRVGRSNHLLSSAELTRLFFESGQVSWDAGPVPEATLDDLDAVGMRQFVERRQRERHVAMDPTMLMAKVLDKLVLFYQGQLSRAAVLLFGRRPQRWLPQAEVRCARFRGKEPLHFLDMNALEGNIIEQVTAAMPFIQRHISMAVAIVPTQVERQEQWEYPQAALREALVNAICHRDYRDSGNVQVRIFDDRLEVWSPRRLPDGVTIAELSRTHTSHPGNHRVARAFFLIGYIEQWGTGTLRLQELCKEAGLPVPEFTETSGTSSSPSASRS